jgi:hypothetical protein
VTAEALSTTQQVAEFIARYSPAIQKEARLARRKIRALLPTATELVYDNYNALVFAFAASERASEAILSIALYPSWVTLFFLHGKGLADPEKLLRGAGVMVRSVRLDGGAADLARAPVLALIRQAVARAKVPLPKTGRGTTVIRAVVKKQRPRRPTSR